jgi:hypothetical protein
LQTICLGWLQTVIFLISATGEIKQGHTLFKLLVLEIYTTHGCI